MAALSSGAASGSAASSTASSAGRADDDCRSGASAGIRGEEACARLARHAASPELAAACAAAGPGRSFGYDVAWMGGQTPLTSGNTTATVIGGGDSAAALLQHTRGMCRGVQISRTLAAFHAARSKHATSLPRYTQQQLLGGEGAAIELHPRFLAPRST